MLAVFVGLTPIVAYLVDLPSHTLFIFMMFCAEFFLLAISFDSEKASTFRVAILTVLLFSVLFFTLTQSASHHLIGADN